MKKASVKKPYHVYYVWGCSPRIATFKTQKELNKFIAKFPKNNDGNWIDFTFKGEVTKHFTDHDYEGVEE